MKATFTTLVVLCLTLTVSAADRAATIRLEIADRGELETLTRLVDIEDVDGLVVQASASPRQLERLREAGYRWQELATAKVSALATMCPTGWELASDFRWDCYPTYDQYVAFLERLAAEHADLCRLQSIGRTSNQNRSHQLWVLVISDNPGLEEDEPEVFYTSTMHGDETTGFVLMLRLAHELLEGYGSNPEITALVDEVELWVNPNANPDGTYRSGDDTVAGAIRTYTTELGTNSFVNPNRNFPDPDDGEHPDGHAWWPETEAMMAFAERRSITLSANFHGGAEVVNYPWDTWVRRHADDEWLHSISRTYADLAQSDSPGGYMTQLDNGVTNGWDWYPVSGGRQDFMTFFHGSRELTIEISNIKLLPAARLPDHWHYNRRALLSLISESLEGIRGRVVDDAGRPVLATIEVLGHDVEADASAVRTDPDVGDFHRMLLPGTYDLRISAPGYETEEIGGVPVSDGVATVVDVTLHTAGPRHGGGRLGG